MSILFRLVFVLLGVALVSAQCAVGPSSPNNVSTFSPFILGSDADRNGSTLYANVATNCFWGINCPQGQFSGGYYSGVIGTGDTLTIMRSDRSAHKILNSGTGSFLNTPPRAFMMRDNRTNVLWTTNTAGNAQGFLLVLQCFLQQCSNNRSNTVITSMPSTWMTDGDGAGTQWALREQERCQWQFACPNGTFLNILPTMTSRIDHGNFFLQDSNSALVANYSASVPMRGLFAPSSNGTLSVFTPAHTSGQAGSGVTFTARCFNSQCSSNHSSSTIYPGGTTMQTDSDGQGTVGRPNFNENCLYNFVCATGQFPFVQILGDPFPGTYTVRDGSSTVVMTGTTVATEVTATKYQMGTTSGTVTVTYVTPASGGNSTAGLDILFKCYVAQCSIANTTTITAPFTLSSDVDGPGSLYSYSNNENCDIVFSCPSGTFIRFSVSGSLDSASADFLRILDGNGTLLGQYTSTTAFSANLGAVANTGRVQFTSTATIVGSGFQVAATCGLSTCGADALINPAYSSRPTSLRYLSTFALGQSTLTCFPAVVAAGNVTWCRADIITSCGTRMGDSGDVDLLALTVCPIVNSTGKSLGLFNATFVRRGVFEFGFTPFYSGTNNVTLLVGVGADEGSKQFATISTILTVVPNVADFRNTLSSCALGADGVTTQCTVEYRDRFGNTVNSCQTRYIGDGDSTQPVETCNVLSP